MKSLLALVAGLAAGVAQAAVFEHPANRDRLERDLEPALTVLRAAPVLGGDYVQRRIVAGLPQPLTSSGAFWVVRGTGVLWQTQEPFESELAIKRDGITQRDLGGAPRHLPTDAQPGLRALAELLLALLVLDLDALTAAFEAYSTMDAQGWVLGLRSRSGVTVGIREVVIRGDRSPRHVRLTDGAGDRTEIDLRDVRTLQALPDPTLRERLTGG